MQKTHHAGLDIYVDDEFRNGQRNAAEDPFSVRRQGDAAQPGWSHLPTFEQTRKENIQAPCPWAGMQSCFSHYDTNLTFRVPFLCTFHISVLGRPPMWKMIHTVSEMNFEGLLPLSQGPNKSIIHITRARLQDALPASCGTCAQGQNDH